MYLIEIGFNYEVISTTSPGTLLYTIKPPFGDPIGKRSEFTHSLADSTFVEERLPAQYSQSWVFETNLGEDFPPLPRGTYEVTFGTILNLFV